MKMVLATGGTGGHIYPAIALADEAKLRYQDFDVAFIGNDDRMEKTEIPAHGYRFHGLHTSGLSGSPIAKVKALMQMMSAYRKAKHILKKEQPDIVIGFGGYVSAPVIMAAHALHIPTMIHEQNSIVGVANKAVMNKADKIVICYEKCYEVFPKEKCRLLGNPRASLVKKVPFDEAYFKSLGLSMHKKTVLVVMGSLGSTSVNEIMKEALADIDDDIQVLYVSGKQNYEAMKDAFHAKNIIVVDYVNQLSILSHIDLIICRAGATTLAEITALGTAAILIPSPYVAHNHQFYNASVLKDHKAAFLVEEKDLNQQRLRSLMAQIMHQSALREEMKKNSCALGFPNAASDILDWIEE